MEGSSARSLVNPLKKLQRKEDLEKEFVESGEKDRVQEIVERRLHESGWAKRGEAMWEEYIAKKVLHGKKWRGWGDGADRRAMTMINWIR